MSKREQIYLRLVRQGFTKCVNASVDSLPGIGNAICGAVKIDSLFEQTLGV